MSTLRLFVGRTLHSSAEQLPITAIHSTLVGHYDPHALDALRDRAIVEGELLGATRCELRDGPGGVAVRGRLGDVRLGHAGFHGSTVAAVCRFEVAESTGRRPTR